MGKLSPRLFKAYDIRGPVDKVLTERAVEQIGKALGSEVVAAGETAIAIGRDGRLSSPRLQVALIQGVVSCGVKVIDLGQVTTPMAYFAAETLDGVNCCAMITGSHNPPQDNGIKMVIQGKALYGEQVQALRQRVEQQRFLSLENSAEIDENLPGRGSSALAVATLTIFPDYLTRIASDIQLSRPLKVVVDAGNGVAGAFAPDVLRAIGAEVIELYCEVDGLFPNHHPDPANGKNLIVLIEQVKKHQADLGLAFDGDGDRCGVVDDLGQVLYPDRQLMLYAQDVLRREPNAEVIYDVKCSGLVAKAVEEAGGRATIWKTGHSLMKAKMKDTGAALGGEVSGHVFFNERWYGFDDGIYTAARLLEIVANQSLSSAELFATLPNAYNTPEIEVKFADGEQQVFMQNFLAQTQFDEGEQITLDGLRVNFVDGWGLVRASNTISALTLRFEGETPDALVRIQALFKTKLSAVDATIEWPF